MAYVPPVDYITLRAAVASDLRDDAYKTFTEAQIGDLINEGIAELNRVRPIERVDVIALTVGGTSYPVTLQSAFLVEAKRTFDPAWWPIPESARLDAGTQDGWDLFGGRLTLPGGMFPLDPTTSSVRVWGYGERDNLVADTDVPEFLDGTDEEGVRCYARWRALEMLLHDRTLYQQWQTQTNNSDISTTQLLQTASSYQQEWTNLRKRLARLRRV